MTADGTWLDYADFNYVAHEILFLFQWRGESLRPRYPADHWVASFTLPPVPISFCEQSRDERERERENDSTGRPVHFGSGAVDFTAVHVTKGTWWGGWQRARVGDNALPRVPNWHVRTWKRNKKANNKWKMPRTEGRLLLHQQPASSFSFSCKFL